MSCMLFKDILIADVQQKKARYVTFESGLNVITSDDNHVGKSSIVKALYRTLGAEVTTDSVWDNNTKLSVVTIDVDGHEYRVARFLKRFAVFSDKSLLLLTDHVTSELAPILSDIFNFSVYLAKKDGNKEVVQAPPAFSFMPYYIDQDKGWSSLYGSFDNMEQFIKSERAKSIYFHLGLYTKNRIENQAKKDRLKGELTQLKEQEQRILVTIKALTEELTNIIPAEDQEELEQHLATPKKEIEAIVQKIGSVRNKIQELQTALQEHQYQLDVIKQFQKIKVANIDDHRSIHVCPQCGYEFDDDLYSLVRANYNQSNEDYLLAQIELIIKNIKDELTKQEERYVSLMAALKEQEKAYDESQDAYNAYLRHRGLAETLRKYQREYGQNKLLQSDIEDEIKEVDKELRKVPDKKSTEECYISHVKTNLIELSVWDQSYEGKIKLTKSIKSQGSLMPKIILSQCIGLFQTMNEMQSGVIRFPFVVDSPRSMEPSDASSKEILNFIVNKTTLPQTILATVDYDKFQIKADVHKIYLAEQFHVLSEEMYTAMKDDIEGLYALLKGEK